MKLGTIGDNAFLEPTSFIDPLSNGTACNRDIPFLKQLSVNAIRVYSVNSSLNHDDCMHALSSAGIYTMCVHESTFRLQATQQLTVIAALICHSPLTALSIAPPPHGPPIS